MIAWISAGWLLAFGGTLYCVLWPDASNRLAGGLTALGFAMLVLVFPIGAALEFLR